MRTVSRYCSGDGCPTGAIISVEGKGSKTKLSRQLRSYSMLAPPPLVEDALQRRAYNAVADFVDENVARGLGDKVALMDSTRSLTYAQLQELSYRFAAGLAALGLRAENRLMLVAPDPADYPGAFWGPIRARLLPGPVNTPRPAEHNAHPL